jgi:hypothetical protein
VPWRTAGLCDDAHLLPNVANVALNLPVATVQHLGGARDVLVDVLDLSLDCRQFTRAVRWLRTGNARADGEELFIDIWLVLDHEHNAGTEQQRSRNTNDDSHGSER